VLDKSVDVKIYLTGGPYPVGVDSVSVHVAVQSSKMVMVELM